jgi:hypothetical protein
MSGQRLRAPSALRFYSSKEDGVPVVHAILATALPAAEAEAVLKE